MTTLHGKLRSFVNFLYFLTGQQCQNLLFLLFITSLACASESNEIQVLGLGVEMSPPTLKILRDCNLKSSYVVMIHQIDKISFAESVEIKPGDLIICINEKVIYSMKDMRETMNSIKANEKLKILLFRNKIPKIVEGNYVETLVNSSDLDLIAEVSYRSWTNRMLVHLNNDAQKAILSDH